MRTIGLIGGMSWESTALYYRIINREVGARLGGLRSAPLLMQSLDFEEVVARQKAGAWSELASTLAAAGRRLERAGAECLLIGTNTMHRVAAEVEAAVSIPLLHITDAAIAALSAAGCRRVAQHGTRNTMEQPFYGAHLARRGIACVGPEAADRAEVHRVIFEELCRGDVDPASRRRLAGIVRRQVERGAEGVLLGCTELTMSLGPQDVTVPLFDTTALHALAAVEFALSPRSPVPSGRAPTIETFAAAPRNAADTTVSETAGFPGKFRFRLTETP
jgi:aspartate racemase